MIVVTGATGRTGRRAAEALLAKGEKVRVIGRDAKKLAPLARLGAEPFVGNVENIDSMTKAFDGASAVYLVLPEDMSQQDLRAHQECVSGCYAAAITEAHVRFAVNLSSIGAQHAQNTGPIAGLHNQEQKLNRVAGLNVLHLRAAYFMENLLMSLAPLRSTGTLPGGLQADAAIPWVATKDIGEYAACRLAARDFSGSSVQNSTGSGTSPCRRRLQLFATLSANRISHTSMCRAGYLGRQLLTWDYLRRPQNCLSKCGTVRMRASSCLRRCARQKTRRLLGSNHSSVRSSCPRI